MRRSIEIFREDASAGPAPESFCGKVRESTELIPP